MERYYSYKDSEIKWIDKIPSNWNKSRIRMVGDLYGGLTGKKGGDFNNEDNPLNKPFVPFTNIFNNTYISKDHFQYVNVGEGENQNRVLKNDLFFLMSSESYEDLGKCSILLEDIEELYLNSFCKGYRIKDKRVNPLFLNYQLLGSLHKEMISIEGNGFTRINLRQNRLLDIPVFIPPIPEQSQIISFLDTKTQKIDKLIKKTKQKIELLKEKRTSLINHCVMKGLNPNVEMKDSGVEWIGEIPYSWEIGKLNHVTNKLTNGYVGPTRGVMKESGVPYIQGIHIKKGEILYTPEGHYYVSEEWSNEHKKSILKEGDVLVVQTGTIGEVGYVTKEFEGCNCHSLIIIQLKSEFGIGKYLNYFIMSNYVKNYFRTIKTGEILEHLNTRKVKYMKICIPPISEQTQIVEYLDEQTQKIDSTIEKETQRFELLKEYRQSLISEVVTGKVDVRNWVD